MVILAAGCVLAAGEQDDPDDLWADDLERKKPPGRFEVLAGGRIGGEILENGGAGAAVRLGGRQPDQPSFSFRFDGYPVLNSATFTTKSHPAFFAALRKIENLEAIGEEPGDRNPFKAGVSKFAIELVYFEGKFLRMYLSEDLKACYFLASDGTESRRFRMAAPLASEIAKLLEDKREELTTSTS
jgi:hypothetical protein